MLLDETLDVADAFLLENLVDSNQNTRLLNITETIVDGCAEEFHRWAQIHIGIDEWRNVVAQLSNLVVEDAIVGFEIVLAEDLCQFLLGSLNLQGLDGDDEMLLVVEMLFQEVEDHVAPATDVAGVHGHLTEEIFAVGIDDGQSSQSVPQIVEGEYGFRVLSDVLIVEADKRASELHGIGCIFLHELL